MIVRELITRLLFDGDEGKIRSFDGAVKNLAIGLGAALGAMTAVSAAGFRLANQAAQYGDEVAKSAATVGLSAEELQRLRFAYDRAGVGQEEFTTGVERLNRNLGSLANGDKAAKKGFDALGISATDSAGNIRTVSELMPEIVQALADIPSEAKRAAIAQELFGRSGVRMGSAIAGGTAELTELIAEYERLGGGLTNEQAKAAEIFADVLTDVSVALNGIKLQIGAELMPVFQKMARAFIEFMVANRSKLIEKMVGAFKLLSEVADRLLGFVGDLISGVGRLLSVFGEGDDATRNFMIAMTGLLFMFKRAWFFAGLFMLVLDDLVAWQQGQDSVIGRLIGSYDGWVERIKSLTDSLGGMEVVTTALAYALGVILALSVAKWLWGVALAVKALTLAMAANPIVLFALAIAAAVGSLIWLYKWVQKNEWIIEGLTAKYEAFKAKSAEFFKPAIKAWEDLKAAGDSFMAGNWLEGSAGLLSTMTNILTQLAGLFNTIFLDPILALWGTSVADLGLKFENAIKAGFDNTVKFFGDMIEDLKAPWTSFVNWAKALAIDILPEWAVNLIADTATKGAPPDDYLVMPPNPDGTLRPIPRQPRGATGTWGDDPKPAPVDPAINNPKPAPVDPEFEKRKGEILEFFDSLSATPVQPGMGEVTGGDVYNSKVITLNAPVSMNVTVPPGTTSEQLVVLRSEIDRAISREVNLAATMLEA